MPTIADYLTSINASKTKLRNRLISAMKTTSENNLSNLVDLANNELWAPDVAWPDIKTWTPAGGIGFVMSNAGRGKVAFKVTTTGAVTYRVVVNDGTNDISTTDYASGAQCDISVTPGTGSVYYRVKITSANAITRFFVFLPTGMTTTNAVSIPMLYFFGNLTSLTSCDSMFYASQCSMDMLQAVELAGTNSVATFNAFCRNCYNLVRASFTMSSANQYLSYLFTNCYSLREIPKTLDFSEVVTAYAAFQNCYSLRSVPTTLNTAKITDMSYMFSQCFNLSEFPSSLNVGAVSTTGFFTSFYAMYALLNAPTLQSLKSTLTVVSNLFGNCGRTYIGTLDFSSVSGMTRFTTTQAFGLRGLLVSSSAPFSGTSPQIDITDCGLNHAALVALINSLPTVVGKTCVIKTNPGTAELTAGEIAVATGKGWTLTVA